MEQDVPVEHPDRVRFTGCRWIFLLVETEQTRIIRGEIQQQTRQRNGQEHFRQTNFVQDVSMRTLAVDRGVRFLLPQRSARRAMVLVTRAVLEDVFAKFFRTEKFPNDQNVENGNDEKRDEHGDDRVDRVDVIQIVQMLFFLATLPGRIDFRGEKRRINVKQTGRNDENGDQRSHQRRAALRHVFQREIHR